MSERQVSPRKFFATLLAIGLCCYLLVGMTLFSPLYGMVVFQPSWGTNSLYRIHNILGAQREEYFFPTAGGLKLHGWFFRLPKSSKVVVVNHGNAGDITNRLFLAKGLLSCGVSVFLYDYRGYGLSQGEPSLDGIVDDGLAAYDFVRDKLGYIPSNIILCGESLGSGVACQVCHDRPSAGLILKSAYTSLPRVAQHGIRWLCAYPEWCFPAPHFDNLAILRSHHPPLLLLHGEQDRLIPVEHAQELFQSASQHKTLVVFPHAAHNDIGEVDADEYSKALHGFFASVK